MTTSPRKILPWDSQQYKHPLLALLHPQLAADFRLNRFKVIVKNNLIFSAVIPLLTHFWSWCVPNVVKKKNHFDLLIGA